MSRRSRTITNLATLALNVAAAVIPLVSVTAASAGTACGTGPRECIVAPHDNGRVRVPDNGIEPLCPLYERGWHETFTAGRFTFSVVCVPGPRGYAAWSEVVK